jgi:hypothetical protein
MKHNSADVLRANDDAAATATTAIAATGTEKGSLLRWLVAAGCLVDLDLRCIFDEARCCCCCCCCSDKGMSMDDDSTAGKSW